MLLLTQETAQIQPVGIVLIVGFAIILIFGFIYDRKKAGKFNGEIDRMTEGKVAGSLGNFTITTDNNLIVRFDAGTGSGYSIFPLAGVAYIMTAHDNTANSWILALYDADRKPVKGEKYDSRKKRPAREKAYFFTKKEEGMEYRDLIHNYAPQAKLVGKYFKDIEE